MAKRAYDHPKMLARRAAYKRSDERTTDLHDLTEYKLKPAAGRRTAERGESIGNRKAPVHD